jgi:hypothetical protein
MLRLSAALNLALRPAPARTDVWGTMHIPLICYNIIYPPLHIYILLH